jgi:hypothetical protein
LIRRTLGRAGIGSGAILVAVAAVVMLPILCERIGAGGPGPLVDPIPAPPPAVVPAEPALKVAFIGDTGAGKSFERVLELVRAERSSAIVHMGDAIYGGETPAQFWTAVDRVLGHEYPYFLAQGNHDLSSWAAMAGHAQQHIQQSGAENINTSPTNARFDLVYKGVSLIALGESVRDEDPQYIVDRLSDDPHIWKICAWHKNQHPLQLGSKSNSTGWGVYESCRLMGALIATAHEHSYHRTKTLANTVTQEVAADCADPHRLCVRPGAVPVFISGLGGRSIRDQDRCLPTRYPYGCKGEWAFVYTANQGARFGALFISFNWDGDPTRARGYFKTVDGQVVDSFELTAQSGGPTRPDTVKSR